jgi:hypothetical protein
MSVSTRSSANLAGKGGTNRQAEIEEESAAMTEER